MDKSRKLRQLLDDVRKDLEGDSSIEGEFVIGSHKFFMRLLNEEETNWRNSHILMSTKLAAVSSFRLPTLAIGIRLIDDVPVFEYFASDWESMEKEIREELNKSSRFSHKYFGSEHLMEEMSQYQPETLDLLWEKWQELEKRREEAVAAVKKSYGESSGSETNSNMTELSPLGEQK